METTETLEQGMYCEVTREQAVELYEIENRLPTVVAELLTNTYVNRGKGLFAWWDEEHGIIIGSYHHGDMSKTISFADFRQRLINTVNNK